MKRLSLLLALSLPLAAQTPLTQYMPGHDKDLYHQEREKEQAAKKNEATVEIEGKLSPAELREIHFQEFMAWFIPDLHRYLGRYQNVARPTPEAIRLTEPPPQAKVYPMGGADF